MAIWTFLILVASGQGSHDVPKGLEVGRLENVLKDDRVEVHGPLIAMRGELIAAHDVPVLRRVVYVDVDVEDEKARII